MFWGRVCAASTASSHEKSTCVMILCLPHLFVAQFAIVVGVRDGLTLFAHFVGACHCFTPVTGFAPRLVFDGSVEGIPFGRGNRCKAKGLEHCLSLALALDHLDQSLQAQTDRRL